MGARAERRDCRRSCRHERHGEAVSVASPELNIATQDASQALVLDVTAQAQTTTIYSEPAVVRFAVQVKNIGQTDAAT